MRWLNGWPVQGVRADGTAGGRRTSTGASTSAQNPYLAIRTRYFDDFLVAAAAPLRQLVLVAAGLDTRAFRLAWPAGMSLYELDRPVLAAKQALLDSAQATARCRRVTVGVNLTAPWEDALLAAGFNRATPSLWMVEGLLPYLDESVGARVLATTAVLAAPGSRLGADSVGRGFLESPYTRSYLQALERENAPWRFGTDEPEAFLAAAGWEHLPRFALVTKASATAAGRIRRLRAGRRACRRRS